MFMFGRIKNIDNRVLEKIGKIHKPVLNKIMIVASRSTLTLTSQHLLRPKQQRRWEGCLRMQ